MSATCVQYPAVNNGHGNATNDAFVNQQEYDQYLANLYTEYADGQHQVSQSCPPLTSDYNQAVMTKDTRPHQEMNVQTQGSYSVEMVTDAKRTMTPRFKVKVINNKDIRVWRACDVLDVLELYRFIAISWQKIGFIAQYLDRDHDFITIVSSDDMQEAFESAILRNETTLKIFVRDSPCDYREAATDVEAMFAYNKQVSNQAMTPLTLMSPPVRQQDVQQQDDNDDASRSPVSPIEESNYNANANYNAYDPRRVPDVPQREIPNPEVANPKAPEPMFPKIELGIGGIPSEDNQLSSVFPCLFLSDLKEPIMLNGPVLLSPILESKESRGATIQEEINQIPFDLGY